MKTLPIATWLLSCLTTLAFAGTIYNANRQRTQAPEDFPTQQNIYLLSPHPDDAILTFGGLIGRPVFSPDTSTKKVYYTVFSNISGYVANGPRPPLDTVIGIRLKEDIEALDFLLSSAGIRKYTYAVGNLEDAELIGQGDADFSNFRVPEAFTAFDNTYRYVFDLMKTASNQGESCAFFVNAALPNPNGKAHFNHFALREASLKALHDLGQSMKCDFYLGEDLPYYSNNEAGSISTLSVLTQRLHLEPITYTIDVGKKLQAVERYPTQVTHDYEESVTGRAEQLDGAEQIYRIPPENYATFHTDASCEGKSFCNY